MRPRSISGDTNANSRLEPGETWIYTCARTVNQDTTNVVTVSGQPTNPSGTLVPGAAPVGDTDTLSVDVVAPAVLLDKQVNATIIYANGQVEYTYLVTNTGDTLVNLVEVTDEIGPDLHHPWHLGLGKLADMHQITALAVDTLNKGTVTGPAQRQRRCAPAGHRPGHPCGHGPGGCDQPSHQAGQERQSDPSFAGHLGHLYAGCDQPGRFAPDQRGGKRTPSVGP